MRMKLRMVGIFALAFGLAAPAFACKPQPGLYNAPLEKLVREKGLAHLSEQEQKRYQEYRAAVEEYNALRKKSWPICAKEASNANDCVAVCAKLPEKDISQAVLEDGVYFHVPEAERETIDARMHALIQAWAIYQ